MASHWISAKALRVTVLESQSRPTQERSAVKTLITVLSLTALATTSVMAQTSKVKAIHRDAANIYQSDAQGNQTFPNPDRDFWGEYFHSRVF